MARVSTQESPSCWPDRKIREAEPHPTGTTMYCWPAYAKAHGSGVDSRTRLERPEFFPTVGGISVEFTRAFALKDQIASSRKNAAVDRDGLFHRPAHRFVDGSQAMSLPSKALPTRPLP